MTQSLRLEYPLEFQGVRNYLFGRQRSGFLNLAQDLCGVLGYGFGTRIKQTLFLFGSFDGTYDRPDAYSVQCILFEGNPMFAYR
jgi:hypothetical protein